MHVDLVLHPSELKLRNFTECSLVVFDVLRATTTMVTALTSGAAELRLFAELDQARVAHASFEGPKLLAGERGCLPPEGFDLGNSPEQYAAHLVAGRTIFMSTTNGTRAVRACDTARHTFVAAFANASATARHLLAVGSDVVLVCAGVDGEPGGEDIDGAATVADAMHRAGGGAVAFSPPLDAAVRERSLLDACEAKRATVLLDSPGGQNLLRVGLRQDVRFAARLDCCGVIAEVGHRPAYAEVRSLAL